MDDRRAARDCQLHDFAGAAATARRKPVPHRDQHVAMRDGRPPGHHISVELTVLVAGQFQHARCALEQRVEPLARAVVGETCAIFGAAERQHDLQFPAKIERDFGRDLVRAVRDRRYEPQARRLRRKAVPLLEQQIATRLGDQQQHIANARPQWIHAPGR